MSQPDNKNDQAKLPDKSLPCCYAQTSEQHRQNLNDIVESHLNEAKNRVTPVYLKYFASPSVVLSRHWRYRGDIPKELATLPRSAWGFIKSAVSVKKNQPDKQFNAISLSGKQLELYTAIEVELLDISGLDKKLQDYVAQYQANFDAKLSDLLNPYLTPYP